MGAKAFPKEFFLKFLRLHVSLMNDARDLKLYTKVWIIESHCCVKFQVRESSQSRVMASRVDRPKKTQRCYEWRERLETSHEGTTHWWTHSRVVSSSRVVSEQSYGLRSKMRNSLKNATEDLWMHTNDHINECVVHVKSQVRQPSLSEVMRRRRDSPNRRVALTNDSTNSWFHVNEQLNEYI